MKQTSKNYQEQELPKKQTADDDSDCEDLIANERICVDQTASPIAKLGKYHRKQITMGNSYKRRLLDNYTGSVVEQGNKARKSTNCLANAFQATKILGTR